MKLIDEVSKYIKVARGIQHDDGYYRGESQEYMKPAENAMTRILKLKIYLPNDLDVYN